MSGVPQGVNNVGWGIPKYIQYLISNKINEIFKKQYNIQINIIITYDSSITCQIGDKEKCKSCSNKIKSNCLTCNEGYYLPFNEINNKICLSCNLIDHCSSCFGEKNDIICFFCIFYL